MIFIGIDDTDNKESRGTGFLSRQLGKLIEEHSLGIVAGITRHQLFVHEDIPYTSRNSSACLTIENASRADLYRVCREYLLEHSAEGSDAGLAMASAEDIPDEVIDFGSRAKKEVLSQAMALALAGKYNIDLEGLTGTKDGIIGALAAIGLRKSGDDGRFIWVRGTELHEIAGIYTIEKTLEVTGIDSVVDKLGNILQATDKINLGDWVRPVIRNNKILLVADKIYNHNGYGWEVASKDFIKSISD